MCTVTYIPKPDSGSFILTSNRDERTYRPTVPPKIYPVAGHSLVYPKDALAGGSWIAMSSGGQVCCLLNGGTILHQKAPHHTYSRGLVLIDIVTAKVLPEEHFSDIVLDRVEPFTLVAVETQMGEVQRLTQLLWNGHEKFVTRKPITEAAIWSSATLYNKLEREDRHNWFERFMENHHQQPIPEEVMSFHAGHHTDDRRLNVLMEREDDLRTVSITQVTSAAGQLQMAYHDLLSQQNHLVEL